MCIRDSAPKGHDIDTEFVRELFKYLKASQVPWPEFWHDWQGGGGREKADQIGTYDSAWIDQISAFEVVAARPETETPESLLYAEIGEIWQPIAENDAWSAFEQKTVNLTRRS